VLLEDGGAPDDGDALLSALVSGCLLGFGDLVAEELGVLVVRQMLEAWGAGKAQLKQLGKVLVVLVEESQRLGGHEWQVLVDGGERFNTGPVVDLIDQMAGDRVGDGIDQLGHDVLWLDQFDHRGLLAGPEGFPATAMGVLVFGEQLVEHLQKTGEVPLPIDDDPMVMKDGTRGDHSTVSLQPHRLPWA
jgi:hypothetical protein